jgi:RING finger protein 113A
MSSNNTIELPSTDAEPPVVFFKRGAKGKSNFRKRAATPPPASDSDSDYSSSDEAAPGEAPKLKKRKRNTGAILVSSKDSAAPRAGAADVGAAVYEAGSAAIVSSSTAEATKQSNWYDADADAEAELLGRKKKPAAVADEPPTTDGTYKGASSYGSFIKKSENSTRKPVGPVKAPTNIRTITITDYAPDVCKDYKLTGFCGFGDTCKFLHAREDYAAGWKLDREWEIKSKGGKMPELQGKKMGTGGWKPTEEKEEEQIPFKCVICKDDYKIPIITKCGHYFCEKCAIDRYRRKNPSCAICGKRTDGVFNGAKGLQKKLDLAREREEERKKKEEEEKEEK